MQEEKKEKTKRKSYLLVEKMKSHAPMIENLASILRQFRKDDDLPHVLHLFEKYTGHEGMESQSRLANEFISVLADMGSVRHAKFIFDGLAYRDENTWNALIIGHAKARDSLNSLNLYRKMKKEGQFSVPGRTFVTLLKVCSDHNHLQGGRELHKEIAREGLLAKDMFIGSTLIDMYTKCGSLGEAKDVFDELSFHNVVTWSVLISGYVEYGYDEQALKLIEEMQHEGVSPNTFTYVCYLKACGNLGITIEGQQVHSEIVHKGLENELHVGNSLISFYMKCGFLAMAKEVFVQLPIQDVVSWTALIAGFIGHGYVEEALSFLTQMQWKGIQLNAATFVCSLKACGSTEDKLSALVMHMEIKKRGLESDLLIGNSLVDAYIKCGLLEAAEKVFDALTVKDVISWTALISGYAEKGQVEEVFSCFDNMYRGNIPPNILTFVSGLKACGSARVSDKLSHLHAMIIKKGFEGEILIGNTLVDAYVKCGSLETAEDVFRKLPRRDLVSWNALISGYLEYGFAEDVLLCSEAMQRDGLFLDVSSLLMCMRACSIIAAIDKGQILHAEIILRGLEKEHLVGSTLIHMYIKCGSIAKARKVFDDLSLQDAVSCNAILAGYFEHRFFDEALDFIKEMQQKCIPSNSTTLICRLRLGAKIGTGVDSLETHTEIMMKGLEQEPLIGGALVDMYAKCGLVTTAESVFHKLPVKDVTSWNAIISGYIEYGCDAYAWQLLEIMQQKCIIFDAIAYSCSFKLCGCIEFMEKGREMHNEVVLKGFENDVLVGNNLVDMYCKCGFLREAQVIFDSVLIRDLVLWNVLITGYVEYGCYDEAFLCYEKMQIEGISSDAITMACILKACVSMEAMHIVLQMHDTIIQKGLEKELLVGSTLADVYAKNSFLSEAQCVFDMLIVRDVVSWNTVISGYSEHGDIENVLYCIEKMEAEGISPDAITLVCSLKSWTSIVFIEELYAKVAKKGLDKDLLIGNTLVDIYSQIGLLNKAQQVFDRLPVKDIVLWTALITGYTEHEHGEEALALMKEMQKYGLSPNIFVFVCSLKVCGNNKDIVKGSEVHADIVKKGVENETFIGNTLMDMYAKCGFLSTAHEIFDDLPVKDVVSWNVLVAANVEHGHDEKVLSYFQQMQKLGVSPNMVTFTCCLKACASIGARQLGREIHMDITKMAVDKDAAISNTLVDMYAKCQSLTEARAVFNRLPVQEQVSWNVMINGYAEQHELEDVLNLFCQMERNHITPTPSAFVYALKACSSLQSAIKGKSLHTEILQKGLESDIQIGNFLVNFYSKCGLLLETRNIFNKLLVRDVVSWNAVMTGYADYGYLEDAYVCIKQMVQEGIFTNSPMTCSTLKVVASIGSIHVGREIHAAILRKGIETELFLGSALIDTYAKCGFVLEAQKIFDDLPDRSVVSWNVLILGHAQIGSIEIVLQLLDRMRLDDVDPDSFTLISFLNACSHTGLVDDASIYFQNVCRSYDVLPTPEHCNCMVDLLGRVGCLNKAAEMITNMPFHPCPVIWHTLLGACRKWGNIELGKHAFEHAIELDENDKSVYLSMYNIYADATMRNEVFRHFLC